MNQNQSFKIWTRRFLALIAGYLLLHAFIWLAFTRDILIADSPHSGDYSRVGYIVGSSYKDKPGYNLPRRHIKNDEYSDQPIDVLTLGDSFSNGCGKPDQYYQDWIASLQNKSVLHVQKLPGKSFFETLIVLLNSGYLDLVRPKFVLLEIVERHATDFLAKAINWNDTKELEEVLHSYKSLRYVDQEPPLSFLNVGNFKFLLYRLLYRVKDNAFFSKIYTRKLDGNYFSVKNGRRLIFAYEDIEHLGRENKAAVEKLNSNLNILAGKLKSKGIGLYFMPVVDKYNLYAGHLLSNPYPRSHFFEILRALTKQYTLIDTKKILSQEVDHGEKDVYYADDSHWSAKAPKKIFEAVKFGEL